MTWGGTPSNAECEDITQLTPVKTGELDGRGIDMIFALANRLSEEYRNEDLEDLLRLILNNVAITTRS
jgi:hypothetical protein